MSSRDLTCASIGYEGRNLEDLCAALIDMGIEAVVDVRASPWSRRPEFRGQALRTALQERGIEYIHCKAAGNPFRPTKGNRRGLDECASLYEEHLMQNPHIVDELEGLVRSRWSALLCYESDRTRCHRGVLLEALKRRNPNMEIVDL